MEIGLQQAKEHLCEIKDLKDIFLAPEAAENTITALKKEITGGYFASGYFLWKQDVHCNYDTEERR